MTCTTAAKSRIRVATRACEDEEMRRLSSRNHKNTSNYTPDHACDDLADEEQPSIVGKLTGTTVSTQMKTVPVASFYAL